MLGKCALTALVEEILAAASGLGMGIGSARSSIIGACSIQTSSSLRWTDCQLAVLICTHVIDEQGGEGSHLPFPGLSDPTSKRDP